MSDERSKGMPDTFDRHLGGLHGLPDVVSCKPTTIVTTVPLLGSAQTFIVQTYRQSVQKVDGDTNEMKPCKAEDTIFLQCVTGDGSYRLVIPPKVADVIARQRDALTAKARSKAAKAVAQERKQRGELPGFMQGRKTTAIAILACMALLLTGINAHATPITLLSGVTPGQGNNVTGTNVVITPVAAWDTAPPAEWVSYANTGVGGFSPANTFPPSPANATFYQDFDAGFGINKLDLTVWADDSATVRLNDALLITESDVQGPHCTAVGLGCVPGHQVNTVAFFGAGHYRLTFDVYQHWGDGYGLLYNGTVTGSDNPPSDPTPESSTLLMAGLGLVSLGLWRRHVLQAV